MPSPRSARLTARFLIASATPEAPAPSALRALFPELTADPELRVRAKRFLDTGDLPLLGPPLPSPSIWTEPLRACAGLESEVARALDAPFHRLVEARPSRASLPANLQAVRLFARAVATAVDGVLADLDSGQVLGAEPEPSGFVLAHGWVGVFISPDGDGLIRADTAGLHRFGLPEISARSAPLGHIHLAANLVRGLAYRLATVHHPTLRTLDDHPSAGSVTPLPGPLTRCATTDVLRFWGLPTALGPSVIVRLIPATTPCPACETALEAVPPTAVPRPSGGEPRPRRSHRTHIRPLSTNASRCPPCPGVHPLRPTHQPPRPRPLPYTSRPPL
ncbi:hypothetical protein AB0L06_39120 [Spirillospora sp. NPDC052269]